MATPFDQRVSLWFWKGSAVTHKTIDGLAQFVKQHLPAVSGIIVKTSDGDQWQGKFDPTPALAINGPESVDLWVQTLARYSLAFHAWAVPKGINPKGETDKIVQVCKRIGVQSMILDVEPYAGFWRGGRDGIRPLMTAIRSQIPGGFHIGLSADSRPQHYGTIFPDEWFPFVQSVHPQIYWATYNVTPEVAVEQAITTWARFNRPVFPVLQANADADSMDRARTISVSRYRVQGLSWWRLGAFGASQWPEINMAIDGSIPSPDQTKVGNGHFGSTVTVKPDSPTYQEGRFDNKPLSGELKSFADAENTTVKYKASSSTSSTLWARWDPQLEQSGWYEISVLIPGQHASTNNARYRVFHALNRPLEYEVPVAQSRYFDLWVPLGVFNFDANDPAAGVVMLNDLTGEANKEISFGAVRWRQILGYLPTSAYIADGFDAPMGTISDRQSETVWPGQWIDATGYAVRYRIGTPQEAYHTGADLNLNAPYFDADAHSPVFAAANGVVTYVGRVIGWGNIIIVRHDPLLTDGRVIYARYAHVEAPRVQLSQRVVRGEQIASVGNADGAYPYHLHFDVSPTSVLDRQPGHWPRLDLNNLLSNYADPRLFVSQNRPKQGSS
jgi:murein DD-endopeptidase MepM/ murein hydrolase activator NlpD